MKITTNIPTNILTTEYRKKINKAIGRGKKFIATLASQRETIILGKNPCSFQPTKRRISRQKTRK